MFWTEDRMQQLRELWASGLPASTIAERIGGVTRNGVMGKARRMGLERRQNPTDADSPWRIPKW